MGVFIDAPRPSQAADPLDAFADFHDAIRDVAAWAPWIVADDGTGNPRDARWLRAFLLGPLAWHLNDEDALLFPRLLRTSPLFDATLESAQKERVTLEAAAAALAAQADALAMGAPVNVARWRAAARVFSDAADRALAHEDCVVLPTARLRLDAQERHRLRDGLVSCEQAREWDRVDRAADEAQEHPVHTVITRRAGGRDFVRRFTACPRGVSVALEQCRACPHAEDVSADDAHRPHVACAIDDSPAREGTVASVMTRAVHTVEPGTPLKDAVALMGEAGVSALPVVDTRGRPIGMVTRGDVVGDLASHGHAHSVADVMTHLVFAVHEQDALERAAQLLVAEGVHRVVVVNEDKELVGVLSTLDVVRAIASPRR